MWKIWFLEFLWGVGTPIGDHSFFFITINGWSDDLMSTRGTFLGNSREDRTPFWNQEPSRRRQKERVVLDAEDTCTLPNRCWPEEGWVSLKIARPFRSTRHLCRSLVPRLVEKWKRITLGKLRLHDYTSFQFSQTSPRYNYHCTIIVQLDDTVRVVTFNQWPAVYETILLQNEFWKHFGNFICKIREMGSSIFYENDLHTVQKIYLMNQLTTSIAWYPFDWSHFRKF